MTPTTAPYLFALGAALMVAGLFALLWMLLLAPGATYWPKAER